MSRTYEEIVRSIGELTAQMEAAAVTGDTDQIMQSHDRLVQLTKDLTVVLARQRRDREAL